MQEKTYIAIDLKSFYASVECVERGLDPLQTNLVVADETRTDKTICLAVTPALKSYGIPGRARLFEVLQAVKQINGERRKKAPGGMFIGKSCFASELSADPGLELDFIIAPPGMAKYMSVSTEIFQLYAKYVSPEDIHVYSVDEVFIDATNYLARSGMTPREFTMLLIRDVLHTTGITATAGIGTNLYLSKIAMDIVAKRMPADKDGVRVAELNEAEYRRQLWCHRPLTDFWRIGRGYAARLEREGIFTMGDLARCSLQNEDRLYKIFGVNAELLIDHAWGWEPCTIRDIKDYCPQSSSLSSGQVLSKPYTAEKGRLVIAEMTDLLVLDLVEKGLVTDQLVLHVGYDVETLKDPKRQKRYRGPVVQDYLGRSVPKSAHGSVTLPGGSSSTKELLEAAERLYDKIVDPDLLVRRLNITANHVMRENGQRSGPEYEQLDLFTDYEEREREETEKRERLEKEKRRQTAILDIRRRFGKNAILKGMDFEEGATTRERNGQVGGHKA